MLPLFDLAFVAVAQGASCPSATTLEVNACASAKYNQADAALNRYYQAALKQAQKFNGATASQALVQSQRAWIVYRDKECDAVFEKWGDGTIRVSEDFRCLTRLSELRTYALWQNWLTFPDSTPPVLPEPALPVLGRAR